MTTQEETPSARQSSGCLTAYIMLVGNLSLFVLMLVSRSLLATSTLSLENFSIFCLVIVVVLLAFVGLYGIWHWKKWGVYTLGGSLLSNILFGVIYGVYYYYKFYPCESYGCQLNYVITCVVVAPYVICLVMLGVVLVGRWRYFT